MLVARIHFEYEEIPQCSFFHQLNKCKTLWEAIKSVASRQHRRKTETTFDSNSGKLMTLLPEGLFLGFPFLELSKLSHSIKHAHQDNRNTRGLVK